MLASVIEAVIGACYLHFGYERTAPAVVEAFQPEIEHALERARPTSSRALQERLARRGAVVRYDVVAEEGPPHERTFEVAAMVDGRGAGARRRALEEGRRAGRGRRPRWSALTRMRSRRMHLRSITLKGFKSFPDRTRLEFAPGVSVIVGPNGSGKSNITDAVLWAMGEQSPLAVRGQSMQDVIFAGGHGVQARSRGRGRGRARQRRRHRRPAGGRDLDHRAGSTAPARASTASTAPAAGSST